MTLNKALKLKNKLVKRISVLGTRMQVSNSFQEGNPAAYNSEDTLKEFLQAKEDLIKLKVAINKANLGISEQIIRIGELKGTISYLQGMEMTSGPRGGYRESLAVIYVVTINEVRRDKLIEQYQTELEELQEIIDKYNVVTEI